jgi:hypothetical protein
MLCSSVVVVDMVASDVLVGEISNSLRLRTQLQVIVRHLPDLRTTAMKGSGLANGLCGGSDGDKMRVYRELMSRCLHSVRWWRYSERNECKELK